MNYMVVNGKTCSEDTPAVSVNSRGLRFGDGLFETIKSISGKLLFFDEHMSRLWKGLQVLQFVIPKHLTPEKLRQDIDGLLQKNGHHHKARIRITVYRGDGGLYDEIDNKPNYILQTWPLHDETGNWNSNGLVLGVYHDVKKNVDVLSGLKHNNFLPYALAALQAKEEKWNDAILLNTSDRVCETTIANIFLIKDAVIYTPALQEGCIDGIMRRYMISEMKAAGYSIIQGQLTLNDLENADEVFLTNSIYNIRWVGSIGNRRYGCSMAQKIYASIFSTKE